MGFRIDPWCPNYYEKTSWFHSVQHFAKLFEHYPKWPTIDDLNREIAAPIKLTNAKGSALQFELQTSKKRPQGAITADSIYDGQILLQAKIPTRANSWHDHFNALCWASFPKTKAAINERQFVAANNAVQFPIEKLPGARSREQDALAMLDEGSVLVLARPTVLEEVTQAVQQADDQAIERLINADQAKIIVFGHALLEHRALGRADIRAMAVVLPCSDHALHTLIHDEVDLALQAWVTNPNNLTQPNSWPGLLLRQELFQRF